MIGYYLTHPQVSIDPQISVPEWSLSELGRTRIERSLSGAWWRTLKVIYSSEERKALETASIVASAIGVTTQARPDMGENDRSSTGFLPPDRFELAADAFFAEPGVSWNGWEKAVDAQKRIVGAVDRVLSGHDPRQAVLFVGHGAVGTLLKCHLSSRPVARCEDQPGGGGNLFAFSLEDRRLLCDWTPVESFKGPADVN